MMMFAMNGVEVVAGCPELPIREVLEKYMANSLETGEKDIIATIKELYNENSSNQKCNNNCNL